MTSLFVNPFHFSTIAENSGDQLGDFYTNNFEKGRIAFDSMIINLGPQHPSTHGVLRILAELHGEYVLRAEPILGYLHRMHDKMGQSKTPWQFLPNMGRVDYLHPIAWNWAYVGAVERLAGLEVPERAEFLRVIACELNRIASHILWWGAFVLDLGAFTPVLYAFEEREKINDLLQIITGSRLTMNYLRFGGVTTDLNDQFLTLAGDFIPYLRERLKMYNDLVTGNIIFRRRLENIGHLDANICRRYGATGPILRAAGVRSDTRRAEPYGVYDRFDFDIPVGPSNDCLGRYLLRLEEICQSLKILEQALEQIPKGLIRHPKAPKTTWKLPAGESVFSIEGARGKISIHLFSDGGRIPYRIKLRSPSFSNLNLFAEAAEGTLLADALAILGSLDLVIPEIDR
ncbi:MAG: NADH-quinone oxidoreductase subunit D [Candidatus Adiutrix intracellularis]|jgi:NADH-quinone oxidoreductase subunit D|nr:NADH-quinone oxidoreductase subunit D [Candidatus Adiutrix intracellularis]